MKVFHIINDLYFWKLIVKIKLRSFIILVIFFAVFVPVKANNSDSAVSQLVQSAEQEFDLENYKEASIFYRKAISKKKQLQDNEIVSEYIGLSLTYLERGQTDTAMLLIDTARYYKNLRNKESGQSSRRKRKNYTRYFAA